MTRRKRHGVPMGKGHCRTCGREGSIIGGLCRRCRRLQVKAARQGVESA